LISPVIICGRAFFLSLKYLFLPILFFISAQTDPRQHFSGRYEDAIRFVKHNSDRLTRLIDFEGGNTDVVVSVIFPELIRFSMWKDYFETKANELMYIRDDPRGKFFSIGMYQIKPTFAEKVESFIQSTPSLASVYAHLYTYDVTGDEQIRAERLKRLKSWIWQTRYVTAFTKIVESRFSLSSMAVDDKIAFICSAYNHDFLCDSSEVVQWISRKSFPYGIKRENPFTYAEVALFFYRNDYPVLFSKEKKE